MVATTTPNCSLNFNEILQREEESKKIISFLNSFQQKKHDLTTKRGIYIYGEPGTGKTTFITNILKENNYDIIRYDAGDIRNKTIIETITKHNMSDTNVISLFRRKAMKIAIVMDEIDGMNNGDKGGINSLIKLIRPKKTKKQKNEEITLNPIICIGNCHLDKKIKELIKVCHTVELKKPTPVQLRQIVDQIFPAFSPSLKEEMIQFSQNDLRKLNSIFEWGHHADHIPHLHNIFKVKTFNEDTKKITKRLLNEPQALEEHNQIMNETDRTVVALLWHENIIDLLEKYDKSASLPFYVEALENICFADYLDRITFQKQIWKFNELSSFIKTFKNNKLYHDIFKKKYKFNPLEVRFTKVLTKYSTEYNNSLFVQHLCQELNMDKKDLFAFFQEVREKYTDVEFAILFENYEIGKLDIQRMYRYLDKYTTSGEEVSEEDDENESL